MFIAFDSCQFMDKVVGLSEVASEVVSIFSGFSSRIFIVTNFHTGFLFWIFVPNFRPEFSLSRIFVIPDFCRPGFLPSRIFVVPDFRTGFCTEFLYWIFVSDFLSGFSSQIFGVLEREKGSLLQVEYSVRS